MKENKPVREEKHDTTLMKIMFSTCMILVAFLGELYVMVRSSDPVFLVVFGLIMIVFVFALILTLIQAEYQKQLKREEQYENIFKSEKASYLLLKSNFDQLDDEVGDLRMRLQAIAEEISRENRAAAKVIVGREKDLSDQLLEKLEQLEEKMSGELARLQKSGDGTATESQAISKTQQEILSELKVVELSIKNEILALKASSPQVMASPVMSQPVMSQPMVEPSVDLPVEPVAEETPAEEPVMEAVEETPAEEPVVEAVEEAPAEEPVAEVAADVPSLEDITMADLEALAEPTPEPVSEPEPTPAPAPVNSDPNHVMTPDEIAALLSGAGEEPAPEPTPEPTPAPAPVNSDPNHVMTPDEIAALIANS